MCYWLLYIIRYFLPENHEECEEKIQELKQEVRVKTQRINELERQLKGGGGGHSGASSSASSSSYVHDDLEYISLSSTTQTQGLVRAIPVPVFFLKNPADLPNIFEVLNNNAMNHDPALSFSLETYHNIKDGTGGEFAVMLALCSTDRIDVTDRELIDDLKTRKGFRNVLVIVLRSGNDPSKFKSNTDSTIPSGVGTERIILQLVYYKGSILEDADANQSSLYKFFQLTKLAYQ